MLNENQNLHSHYWPPENLDGATQFFFPGIAFHVVYNHVLTRLLYTSPSSLDASVSYLDHKVFKCLQIQSRVPGWCCMQSPCAPLPVYCFPCPLVVSASRSGVFGVLRVCSQKIYMYGRFRESQSLPPPPIFHDFFHESREVVFG